MQKQMSKTDGAIKSEAQNQIWKKHFPSHSLMAD